MGPRQPNYMVPVLYKREGNEREVKVKKIEKIREKREESNINFSRSVIMQHA